MKSIPKSHGFVLDGFYALAIGFWLSALGKTFWYLDFFIGFFKKQLKTVEKMSPRLSLELVEIPLDCGFGISEFYRLVITPKSKIRNCYETLA
ncbi:hypothetical protein BWI92_11560 [Flectobacillus sp. BAB-3569]|nr:hypothetical protein BWI92_11560 [Flectobacillus sp. BAB-3569]